MRHQLLSKFRPYFQELVSLPFVSRDDTIVTERIWEAPSDETPRTKTLENKRFHLEKTFLKNYEKEKLFACVCVILCVCSGVRAFVGSGNLSIRMRLRAPVFVSVNNFLIDESICI